MRHADAEWANRSRQPMAMPMINLSAVAMEVDMRAVVVRMGMHVPSIPVELDGQVRSQDDEQESHPGFRDKLELIRNTNPERQDDRADNQKRYGVADAPP